MSDIIRDETSVVSGLARGGKEVSKGRKTKNRVPISEDSVNSTLIWAAPIQLGLRGSFGIFPAASGLTNKSSLGASEKDYISSAQRSKKLAKELVPIIISTSLII